MLESRGLNPGPVAEQHRVQNFFALQKTHRRHLQHIDGEEARGGDGGEPMASEAYGLSGGGGGQMND